MYATRTVEVWVGVFVTLGLIALLFVAIQVSNLGEFQSAKGSYVVKAYFGNVGGLRPRAPVSMAGVTVGRVESISFDDKRYEALVKMRIEPNYKSLPEDTSASILTAGLLGEQYVGLAAGASDDYLKEGDEIELTQSAVILEQLISRFLFNKAEEGKGDKKAAADAPAKEPVSAVEQDEESAPTPPAKLYDSQTANVSKPAPVVKKTASAAPRQEAAKASKVKSGESTKTNASKSKSSH